MVGGRIHASFSYMSDLKVDTIRPVCELHAIVEGSSVLWMS